MTLASTQILSCPECGAESEFELYDSVNAQVSPELAEELIGGTLFSHECPSCGSKTNVFYSCLYNDMESQMMVQLTTEEESEEFIREIERAEEDPLVAMAAQGYEKRIVFTQNELREKALLLRDGYDDGLMEVFKLFVKMMGMKQGSIGSDVQLLYNHTDDDEINIAVIDDAAQDVSLIGVPKGMYVDLGEQYGTDLGKGAGYRVDEKWAIGILNGNPPAEG